MSELLGIARFRFIEGKREEYLRLAEQALKALPKPKFENPAHPFADDAMWR